MRNPKRIREFCNELADIWESQCPDWRLGQLIDNVCNANGIAPNIIFFVEEVEMMKMIKEYFKIEDK